jgi:hypothetical protein
MIKGKLMAVSALTPLFEKRIPNKRAMIVDAREVKRPIQASVLCLAFFLRGQTHSTVTNCEIAIVRESAVLMIAAILAVSPMMPAPFANPPRLIISSL